MRKWYRGLTPPVRVLIQVVLLILVLGPPISFFLYSKFGRLAALRPEVAELSGKTDTSLRRVTGFTRPTEAEKEAWAASRSELLAKLPPEEDLPRLVEAITLLAGRSRVMDLLISTSARVPLKKNAESVIIGESAMAKAQGDLGIELGYFPIQITFQSGYRDLARFLGGIQQLPSQMTVASMEVRRGVPHVGVRMVLRAYHSGSGADGTR